MSHALMDDARVLRSVAARIVGESDADDVVQETFLRALVSPPADADSPIRPWLVTVARHVAIDWLRKRGRVELAEVVEVADEAEPPARGRLAALLAGLGRLSEGEVVVLLLRDALDLSVDEVAEALGSTAGTVRVLHVRARRKAVTGGLDAEGLVALDRFLTWLLAREVAGLPVRARTGPDPDPAFSAGVMEAHGLLLDAVVEAAQAAGRSDLEARARLFRGSVRRHTAPEAALDDLRRGVALGGDTPQAGWWIAGILLQLGRRDEAIAVADAALGTTTDRKVRFGLHQLLAFLHTEAGDLDAAGSHNAAACQADGPAAHFAAGNTLYQQERYEEARVELMLFLASTRERGRPNEETVALVNLGCVSLDLGDDEHARTCFRHALTLARRHGDRMRETTAVGNLACIDRVEGRLTDAAEGFARAVELARATSRPAYEELYRMNAAVLDHIRGRLEQAESELRGCVARQSAAGLGWDVVASRVWLVAVEAELGRSTPEGIRAARQAAEESAQRVHVVMLDLLEVLAGLDGPEGEAVARARIDAVTGTELGIRTAVLVVRAALERRSRARA